MKPKLTEHQRSLFEILVFLAKLTVFAIPLYAILAFHYVLSPLQEVVSQNVVFVLQLHGIEMAKQGFLVSGGGIGFFISEDCTGWKSMLFMAALVFAAPKVGLKKRIAGIAMGVPIIYFANLMRILLVVCIWVAFGYGVAGIFHDYLWQAGLAVVVITIWTVWLKWAGRLGRTFLK